MNHLLIIDPQNDFCDSEGSLYVPGAGGDMQRLANYIYDNKNKIDRITISLDTHRAHHIAHPIFWKDANGEHPKPFTLISKEDILQKKWYPLFYEIALNYVSELERLNNYNLCVWPEHCLIGSWGASIYPILLEAILDWERTYADVEYVTKGLNMFTEHYSILKAEVIDAVDKATGINIPLLNNLLTADTLLVAGEASSHCVANSMYDLIILAPPFFSKKIKLLTNCMSPVPGFEHLQENLFNRFETI